jgi:predicted nucleotidyltransferase
MRKQTKRTTMLSPEEVISILKKELPDLKNRYGVESIFLFGSFAKGKQTKKSDIDMLVDIKKS